MFPWRRRSGQGEPHDPALAAAQRAVQHSGRQFEAAQRLAEVVDRLAEKFERIRAEDHFAERFEQAVREEHRGA